MTIDETGTTTLTFLFSDVEGSTALLRKLRDGYGAVIGTHERLLRAAWEESGGRELDADGDSFFVAFRRPREAVDAAIAAQRSARSRRAAGRTGSRFASGSASTPVRRRSPATSTSDWLSIGRPASATPGTAARS